MKNKKKADYTLLLHVVIVFLVIFIIYSLFTLVKNKDVNKIAEDTTNIYAERIEDTNKAVSQAINKQKDLMPFQKYKFKYTYTLNVNGKVNNINFQIRIPSDEAEKQYISDFKITPSPAKTYHDGTNNIGEYIFNNVNTGKINITVEGIANVRTYDLKTAKALNKNITPEKDLTRYLKPEKYIESDDSSIKQIAQSIPGNTKEEIVNNIYKFTQKSIKYEIIPKTLGAKEALKLKKGKCSEFAAIMVAILRAKNIPARITYGVIARDNPEKHGWVEVYFYKYGWVTFDPTVQATIVNVMQDGKIVRQETIYDTDKSKLKYITSGRNYFSTWNFNYITTQQSNGKVSVSDTIEVSKAD